MSAYSAAFRREVLVPSCTNANVYCASQVRTELPLQVASGDRVKQIHVSTTDVFNFVRI
jgi:hypothetical protein